MYSGASSLRLRNIAPTRGWSVRYNIIAAAAAGDAIFLICIYAHTVHILIIIYDIIVFYNAPFLGEKTR